MEIIMESAFWVVKATLIHTSVLVAQYFMSTINFLFFFLVFLGPHPWHMEISRLGVELEL